MDEIKASQLQGLKEAYLASMDNATRLLEKSFKLRELKGETVKVFLSNDDDREIIYVLGEIE